MKPLPLPCGAVLRPILIAALGFYTCGASMAYESNYEPTPVGAVEVKDLPPAKVLEAEGGDDYFEVSSGLFRKLFRYLQAHELSMTVPVEADPQPARMRFFVERGHAGTLPSGEQGVVVVDRPASRVVSVGLRGGYSRENFNEGVAVLREWLASHPAWVASGGPYAVYWNGPFTPWFLKRSEVHLPIAAR